MLERQRPRRHAFVIAALILCGCSDPWQKCIREGGKWFTSARDPDAKGVCVQPAADAGKACHDRKDCQVLCLCPGNLSFPGAEGHEELNQYEGAEMEGACAEYPPASGSGWQCTVDGGKVHRHGIIVD